MFSALNKYLLPFSVRKAAILLEEALEARGEQKG